MQQALPSPSLTQLANLANLAKSSFLGASQGLLVTFLFGLYLTIGCTNSAKAELVSVGAGAYVTAPRGIDVSPPPALHRTASMANQAAPTNQWYSSILFSDSPEVIFVQPLAVKFARTGFELSRPIKTVVPTERRDVEIHYPHSPALTFTPTAFKLGTAQLAQRGDWSVAVSQAPDNNPDLSDFQVTLAHGSPFASMKLSQGDLRLELPKNSPAQRLDNGQDPEVIALKIAGAAYAVFLPEGGSWERKSPTEWIAHLPTGKGLVAAAALPDEVTLEGSEHENPSLLQEVLATFKTHAFAFISDTRVDWRFDPKRSQVTTEFIVTENNNANNNVKVVPPFLGLYPHQWFNNPSVSKALEDTHLSYQTLRGKIRLMAATHFKTQTTYTGFVPYWPAVSNPVKVGDKTLDLSDLLGKDIAKARPMMLEIGSGPYWQGKGLERITQLMNVAEQQGDLAGRDKLLKLLKERIQKWFSGQDSKDYFVYDKSLGTVVAYPEEYFAVKQMNDHHFHYGYWIRAMADIALRDPEWASDAQWGGMVNLLVKDIATSERGRSDFPFLRNFDPYEGHSWASGVGLGPFGNNQESSSEAVNAWAGLIQWAEVKGDVPLRDLGIFLYTTEINAINHYWFDIHHQVFAPEYKNAEVSMLFGGKYAHNTWWIDEPRQIHGINLLPITTASNYLATDPAFVNRNLAALVPEMAIYAARGKHAQPDDIWQDIFAEYQAYSNPQAALARWDRWGSFELGDTRSHALHLMAWMQEHGTPDLSVTADTTLYSVFKLPNGQKTHLAFNASKTPITVHFSDGVVMNVPAQKLRGDL